MGLRVRFPPCSTICYRLYHEPFLTSIAVGQGHDNRNRKQYSGFLFLDKDHMPLVSMHWEHRFNSIVGRYNEIYKMQIPNITPHVCRHTYCSNQAKAGMNPKTLQYLMGHSDIAVTLNVYTHVGLEDAENELRKMQTLEGARKEMGLSDKDDKPLKQTMFKVV